MLQPVSTRSFADYVGLPFLEKGRDRAGIDCWGLLRLVYRELAAVVVPSYADDYELTDRHTHASLATLIMSEARAWRETPAGAERMFDGVVIRMGRAETHIGVVVEPGRMLHIRRHQWSTIERYHGRTIAPRITGFYRHAELI